VLLVFPCGFLGKLERRKLLEMLLLLLFVSITQTVGRIQIFIYVPCTELKKKGGGCLEKNNSLLN